MVTRTRAHRLQAKLEAQGWPTRTVVDAETGARREVDLDEAGRRAYLAEQLALGFELDATRIDADETRKFITKGLVNSLWGVSAACVCVCMQGRRAEVWPAARPKVDRVPGHEHGRVPRAHLRRVD